MSGLLLQFQGIDGRDGLTSYHQITTIQMLSRSRAPLDTPSFLLDFYLTIGRPSSQSKLKRPGRRNPK